MTQEIEVKFLNVDHDNLRTQLKEFGAICSQPERLMRRVILDYPDRRMQTNDSAWIRVRDEGDKISLTYKTSTEHVFGGAGEIEVSVSDYHQTVELFKAIGLVVHAEQQSKRETWHLDGAEVVLDIWPWLDPYMEVEASSEKIVQTVSAKLGFDWKDAVFGSITTAYRKQYPDITKDEHISTIPRIAFDLPRPDWFVKQ